MSIEPNPNLLPKIMKRIQKEQKISVYKRLGIFSFTLIASSIAILPAVKFFISDVSGSGFLSFSSLLFSDFASVLSYWRSFLSIVLETLPAISFALVMAVFLTMFESIVSIIKNIRVYKTIQNYEFR